MRDRERLAIQVARLYYIEQVPMPEIAREFDISSSTVSRLISLARGRGWVRFIIDDPEEHQSEPVRRLKTEFGLQSVTEVPVRKGTDMTEAVGRRAAEILNREIGNYQTIGIAWGTTTAAIAAHLSPNPRAGCTVVQLNGAGSPTDLEIDYAIHIIGQFCTAWDARAVLFPVPAFFDDPMTRTALWKERSVRHVLEIQRSCQIAIFSIGSIEADRPSRVYTGGYLTATDTRQLADDQAIGDIATYFFDDRGQTADIELNQRASGLPLDELRDIQAKYCVAAGTGKAAALASALKGGYIDHLVADTRLLEATADEVR